MLDAATSIQLLAHVGHISDASSAASTTGADGLVLLLVALPFVAGAVALARSREPIIPGVVLFSAAAGFVHAMVTPPHFREGAATGLFTLAVTVGQMAVVVVALNWPSRTLWRVTAVGNGAVLAVWALSRTTGLPLGPAPWTPEPVGLIDLACSAYEFAIVGACLWISRTAPAPARSPTCLVFRTGGPWAVQR